MSTLNPTNYSAANPLHIHDPDDTPEDRATLDESEFLCAGHHPARAVEWLWPDRIPLGKVSLLIGNPGLGKSLLTIDMAARVTRGLPFPIVTDSDLSTDPQSAIPNPQSSPPGSVIIMSASDDLTDTIRPRLDAAGADANRVFVLPKIRDLRTDFAKLRAAVEAAPNCRLIIVDPVNAYVGPSDSHFHTVVRRVLEPLAELAAEKNLAILAVMHLRKNDGAAIQRAAGSMGFVSMARTIWTVAEDPKDPARRLFLPLKNNLGPDVPGFAFRIESHPIRRSPRIAWDPIPLTTSTREALTPPKPPRRPTERDAAREFLRQALADGPRPARELFNEAREQGFTPRTLQRAFHELEGHTVKEGWLEGWWWSLGEYPVKHIENVVDAIPDFGAPSDYAADVGYCDAQRQLIDIERFRAVTGRKHLSPSLNLSPSPNLWHLPDTPPPNHVSPSAHRSPSNSHSKFQSPKSPANSEVPPNQIEPTPNSRRAACDSANFSAANPLQSPATRPLTPPRPPENDIIKQPPPADTFATGAPS